jgi:hypothetical protein
MSQRVRKEEEWMRLVIERHLSCAVNKNDYGSRGSMYDLRVGAPDNPEYAIECVQDTCDAVYRWMPACGHGVHGGESHFRHDRGVGGSLELQTFSATTQTATDAFIFRWPSRAEWSIRQERILRTG